MTWLSEARNKKSVTIDLHHPEGVELFKKLIAKSDILCENFRPGTLEKWGLGWEVLREVNPGLIMLRVTGYGQTGPYKNRPGFARIAHAVGGLAYLSGMPKGAPVTPGSTTLGDYMTGLYGCLGVLLALRYREQTGKGQYIDAALYESVFRCTDELAPAYSMFGTVRERHGPTHNDFACPYGHFPTKDGKWVAIACATDKLFERLAQAMGRPELASHSIYGDQTTRLEHRHDVNEIVRDWCGSLDARGSPGALLCDRRTGRTAEHDRRHLRRPSVSRAAESGRHRRRRCRRNGDRAVGDSAFVGNAGRIKHLGPRLGAHTEEVLQRLAGRGRRRDRSNCETSE